MTVPAETAPKKPVRRAITVPETAVGARLDKWLAEAVPGISRSRVKTLIEDGGVTVQDAPVTDAAYRLKLDEKVVITVPVVVEAAPAAQTMDLDVVFEDEHLIVINKPVGMVVHPAPGNPDHTLVNALLAHCKGSLSGIGGVKRPGIVHRIDKDTSGLLVAAKTEAAHAGLSAQFAAHTIDRTYDALIWGVPPYEADQIIGAIGRSHHNRQKMAIVKRGGKHAETGYRVVDVFGTLASHIRCKLKTGRTHQIRVHMASIGLPLIGDATYGSNRRRSMKDVPKDVAAMLKAFPRQALHASTLGFEHPITGETMKFERDPPDDWIDLLEGLREINMLEDEDA
jgi:23S rRNA pseudouridine1911/1915/1917 synthase